MNKRFPLLVVSLICLAFASKAQKSETLVQLTKEGLRHSSTVQYHTDDHVLQIDSLLIPCTRNSVVKLKNTNSEYRVEFFLQRNTSIRNINNASFRRAWFALPFQSRESAINFINAFQKISHSHHTN